MKTSLSRVEKILRQIILKDLANKGRRGWDKPHTEAVVYWIKYLLEEIDQEFDHLVMVTAAYAHDWGYMGLFEGIDSSDYREIIKRKKMHMKLGADKIEQLIYRRLSRFFTEKQTLRTVYLVEWHDAFDKIKDEDQVLLLEADTLGAMDMSRLPGGMSYESNQKYVRDVREKRFPLFRHKVAKEMGEKLLQERIDFYENKFKSDDIKPE
ncbi:MAG: hypothetical protein U9O78_00240 [Patescibacteria group bacterium]|nr:hypothetical protein [Patescibacteria group bacterium]